MIREALAALADGLPRLMVLGQADETGGPARAGVVSVPMACESEGAMEVYLEPTPAPTRLVVIGRTPAVDALAIMAATLGWRATVVDDRGSGTQHPGVENVVTTLDLSSVDASTFVVVATQGHYDEEALAAALATEAEYVGLVASRKRAASVMEYLRDQGVPEEALARVHAPAGLDLGSVDHQEMAVAVLAELVALRATRTGRPRLVVSQPETAIDPVCGMTVDVATARYHTEHDGRGYYFCAAGCLRSFESDPGRYLGG